jgi:cytochrome c biogenesis protein
MQRSPPPPTPGPSPVKLLFKRLLRRLANLQLAIAELSVIAGLTAVGTVIEQNKPYEFYVENYPEEGRKVLGFLSYNVIYALQWDHIYSANYFLLLLALLGASLVACTTTTQWPAVRVAQRWRFKGMAADVAKLEVAEELPNARIRDVAAALAAKGYLPFVQGGSLYAFKGLAGKLGPIGVHASMLAVMLGTSVGALGGFGGTAMIPEGSDSLVAELLRPNTSLARYPAGA